MCQTKSPHLAGSGGLIGSKVPDLVPTILKTWYTHRWSANAASSVFDSLNPPKGNYITGRLIAFVGAKKVVLIPPTENYIIGCFNAFMGGRTANSFSRNFSSKL